MLVLWLAACDASLVVATPVPQPPPPSPESPLPTGDTGPLGPPTPPGGEDTGHTGPTADTGVYCGLGTVPPGGGTPVRLLPLLSDAGQGYGEWSSRAHRVFIIDEVAGFAVSGWIPGNPSTTMWWHPSSLPTSPSPDRQIANGGDPVSAGDLTGDGIDDLAVYRTIENGTDMPDGDLAIVHGPLSAFLTPFLTVDILTTGPGRLFACGDLTGDGIADLCGTTGVDAGPPDGVKETTFSPSLLAETSYGADLNGNGVNELYVKGPSNTLVRRPPLGAVVDLPGATWGSPASHSWPLDPDGDGTDELYVPTATGMVRIGEAEFAAGTSLPTNLPLGDNLVSGDFDGDGVHEFAVTVDDGVLLVEADGTERLVLRPQGYTFGSAAPFGRALDVGDVDGNGIDDLIIGMPLPEDGEAYFVFDPLDCSP